MDPRDISSEMISYDRIRENMMTYLMTNKKVSTNLAVTGKSGLRALEWVTGATGDPKFWVPGATAFKLNN